MSALESKEISSFRFSLWGQDCVPTLAFLPCRAASLDNNILYRRQ